MLESIHAAQLDILGLTKEYRIFIGLFVCMIVITLVLLPFIRFLSNRHYTAVLTYIIISLLMIVQIILYAHILNDMYIIKIGLRCIVAYGLSYAVFLIYRKLRKDRKSVV